MGKYLILVFVLYVSCRHNAGVQKMLDVKDVVCDSFYIDFNSKNGSVMLYFSSDTLAYTVDQFTNEINTFKRKGKVFISAGKFKIPDNYKMWFHNILEFKEGVLSFITNREQLVVFDFNKMKTMSIVNLNEQGDTFRFVQDFAGSQPLIYRDDKLWIRRSYRTYPQNVNEFKIYANSNMFVKYTFADSGSDSVVGQAEFGKYPPDLLNFQEPYPRYTFNIKEKIIAIVYEPRDSIYLLNMLTGEQRAMYIPNNYYIQPRSLSPVNLVTPHSADEIINHYSRNFRYTGIRYNTEQNHYLLTFMIPRPTLQEWINSPILGLVLDKEFKPIYYIRFELDTKPMKQGDFVNYLDKVAIRAKESEHYEKYYVLDF
ncbi:MAG: hypothetical protein GC181_12335 [Bacteroidetes bacterium]|nr:hypothetical protein [Bacteroidota bacterium]